MPSAEQVDTRPSAKSMAVDANLMPAMAVRLFLCAMQEVTGEGAFGSWESLCRVGRCGGIPPSLMAACAIMEGMWTAGFN